MNAILFDVDGTLTDTSHREHLITLSESRPKKDWAGFFGGMGDDPPKEMAITILRKLSEDYLIVLLTGRYEEHRKVTEMWLDAHAVHHHLLLMRPDGDSRQDSELKESIYLEKIKPAFNVKLVLEDRNRNVNMWRSLGLECWQVCNGDF